MRDSPVQVSIHARDLTKWQFRRLYLVMFFLGLRMWVRRKWQRLQTWRALRQVASLNYEADLAARDGDYHGSNALRNEAQLLRLEADKDCRIRRAGH